MFMIYALLAGLAAGRLSGGRFAGLAALEFRWAPLAVAGFLVQVVLFAEPVSDRIGAAGPPIYVVSTLAVLVAVVRNLRYRGLGLVALGAVSNLAAIVANGGYMPTSPAALAALGKAEKTTYSNSSVVTDPALAPLTDVFAMPAWVPFANVFSIGDVLIGLGIIAVVVSAMHRPLPERASPSTGAPAVPSVDPVRAGNSTT